MKDKRDAVDWSKVAVSDGWGLEEWYSMFKVKTCPTCGAWQGFELREDSCYVKSPKGDDE